MVYLSSTFRYKDRESVLPAAVTIVFFAVYVIPAVPPLTQIVAVVVVAVSVTLVIPEVTVHEDVLIVSPLLSQSDQSNV